MKVSEIIGSELKSADGMSRGYVRAVYACGDRIVYLACADCEEREFNASFHGLKFTSCGIVFNGKTEKAESAPVRLGVPAFTEHGKFAGFVNDVYIENDKITCYLIGKRRYSPAMLSIGDAVIIRRRRVLKEDVVKGGKVILKKGTEIDDFVLKTAEAAGEYVQAQLKSL